MIVAGIVVIAPQRRSQAVAQLCAVQQSVVGRLAHGLKVVLAVIEDMTCRLLFDAMLLRTGTTASSVGNLLVTPVRKVHLLKTTVFVC